MRQEKQEKVSRHQADRPDRFFSVIPNRYFVLRRFPWLFFGMGKEGYCEGNSDHDRHPCPFFHLMTVIGLIGAANKGQAYG